MTKLDDIEIRNKNFFSLTCRSFVDDMDYMIKLARKAEEMAKFYADESNYSFGPDRGKDVDGHDIHYEQDTFIDNDDGEFAREFLSFLEKGE